METKSSGEELLVKTRKPYTITKQREKWTEEEHNKFIEALKLYGRAWQRIEEHIGTKTTVQIRSHAQKFFTKLEKEAGTKGVTFGQAHDLEIPPPRPKRKPSTPYPRKTGVLEEKTIEERTMKSPSMMCKAGSIENYAAWRMQGPKDTSDDNSCSEVINLFHDAPAATAYSLKNYNRFMPLEKEMKEKHTTLRPVSISVGLNNKNMTENETNNVNRGSEGEPEELEVPNQTDKISQGDRSCVKNVPVDLMKKTDDKNVETNADSGISSVHHPLFLGFPPFSQLLANQDVYKPFFNVPSTLSTFIASTLLQHPAVHAAASVAASYCLSINMDPSTASSLETRNMNPSPSMASVAAATVAAASAWWATQGLLPFYPTMHSGIACTQLPTTSIPIVDTTQAPNCRSEEKVNNPEQPEALKSQASSSDTGDCGRDEIVGANDKSKFSNDVDTVRNEKKLYQSSCGSNTPSGSEVETDVMLKKQDGEKYDLEQAHVNNAPLLVESNNRRVRSSAGILNESWKEVSVEGRVAFRALFTREVLPQSFSATLAEESMVKSFKDSNELPVDLNQKPSSEPTDLYYVPGYGVNSGKNQPRRTGFRPYKRCSVEAKENRATVGEENANKRIRLEGETSI